MGNLNGNLDILTANGNNTIGIVPGNGNGTFQPIETYPVQTTPQDVGEADFNGDGTPDLEVTGSSSLEVLYAYSNGAFQSSTTINYTFPFVAGFSSIIADFNGRPDIVVAGETTTAYAFDIFINNGNGTFTQQLYNVLPYITDLVAADFNGDGKMDLALSTSGGILEFLGNGDGTFAAPQTVTTNGAYSIGAGDFNGDGKMDLVGRSPVSTNT